MTLARYIDLYELLQTQSATREEKRAFGLAYTAEEYTPLAQLVLWTDRHRKHLTNPSPGEKFSAYLYHITLLLSVIAFVFGLFGGAGLLSYSGHEPVNIIYFLFIVVLVPLTTLLLTSFSMLRVNTPQRHLLHLSPAFWMEKVVLLLHKEKQTLPPNLSLDPLLIYWLILKRSQLLALLFSLGMLTALLGMVVTTDIAFGWSTTLQVSPEAFYTLLYNLAFAWRDLFEWALPSIELIEQSQYFRLGERLDSQMIAHASTLGEWWKFLAFATLFYAILLRGLMWLVTYMGFNRVLRESTLHLEGVEQLLKAMNEPSISMGATQKEPTFIPQANHYNQTLSKLDTTYDSVFGWAMSEVEITRLNSHMQLHTDRVVGVGGTHSLESDKLSISESGGEVLIYVKAWEPPVMDCVDFLEALSEVVSGIAVVPVGEAALDYRPQSRELEVWGRKLQSIQNRKIWLKQ